MIMKTAFVAALAVSVAPTPGLGSGAQVALRGPGVVQVRMVDNGGGQWRFEPATIVVRSGDTVRFLQTDVVPHNVQFKNIPEDAALGAAVMGPFLLEKGATYDLVIDDRFAPGSYEFVCTPHEMMGMKGAIEVRSESQPPGGGNRFPALVGGAR